MLKEIFDESWWKFRNYKDLYGKDKTEAQPSTSFSQKMSRILFDRSIDVNRRAW